MQVEDHPLDSFDLEGVIPAGGYGAGEVIVWDWGTHELVDGGDPAAAIAGGKVSIRMHGEKLRGAFTLVKMRGGATKGNAWLLLRGADKDADPRWSPDRHEASVKSGLSLADIKAIPTRSDGDPLPRSRRPRRPGRAPPRSAARHCPWSASPRRPRSSTRRSTIRRGSSK